MFKGTPELIAQRREEIINVCERLYQTMGFREITLKEIGKATDFSRPTIYNYFHTKEEIFLALFKREYDRWNEDLENILDATEGIPRGKLAHVLADSLAKREQLLKLLSMNNYDMEANSRLELLTEFKISYGKSIRNIGRILVKFCPEMSASDMRQFIYMFFPFMFGIYPYTAVTDKQRAAMKEARIDFAYQSIYEITHACLMRLLGISHTD